jgi:hypothetical protein
MKSITRTDKLIERYFGAGSIAVFTSETLVVLTPTVINGHQMPCIQLHLLDGEELQGASVDHAGEQDQMLRKMSDGIYPRGNLTMEMHMRECKAQSWEAAPER